MAKGNNPLGYEGGVKVVLWGDTTIADRELRVKYKWFVRSKDARVHIGVAKAKINFNKLKNNLSPFVGQL